MLWCGPASNGPRSPKGRVPDAAGVRGRGQALAFGVPRTSPPFSPPAIHRAGAGAGAGLESHQVAVGRSRLAAR